MINLVIIFLITNLRLGMQYGHIAVYTLSGLIGVIYKSLVVGAFGFTFFFDRISDMISECIRFLSWFMCRVSSDVE